MEQEFGCHLTIGPALVDGFYYDGFMGNDSISDADLKAVEKQAQALAKKKAPSQRIVLTKDEALDLFEDNPFKVQIISTKIPDGGWSLPFHWAVKLFDQVGSPCAPPACQDSYY